MTGRVERAFWVASVALSFAATWLRAAGSPSALPERDSTVLAEDHLSRVSDDSLGLLVLGVVSSDPFRLARAPSMVPYGAQALVAVVATPVPIPDLRLAGVLGPPWRAMVEGFPGRDGAVVVAVGDTLGGIRVRAIRPAAIDLSNPDTNWTLTMRRTWQ